MFGWVICGDLWMGPIGWVIECGCDWGEDYLVEVGWFRLVGIVLFGLDY